ncbi:MAG TPA: 50S ribosomal protein L24 [Spirochaetia bacterium]|jgi:large subunit ribosomal protein L24|nr:50S ribosomal protein L24 [Spirochaetia bacterium]
MKEKIHTKLKKEDTVKIIAGKDKGKSGKILKIDRVAGRVIVSGLNMVKKAKKPKNQQDKGGIVDVEAPIDISNVMIVCKKCGPTRIGFSVSGDSKKRICRKCGEAL